MNEDEYWAKYCAMTRDERREYQYTMAAATNPWPTLGDDEIYTPSSALYREYAIFEHPLWDWGLDKGPWGAAYHQLWANHHWEYIDQPILDVWKTRHRPANGAWRLSPFEYDPSSVVETPRYARDLHHEFNREWFQKAADRAALWVAQNK